MTATVGRSLRTRHTILLMTQELDLDAVIRARIRGLRLARGWSLDALATRCGLSASTLSRIETGHRRIAIDQLSPIARALGTSIDQLVELTSDDDVVIHPRRNAAHGHTTWLLTREDEPNGLVVAKMRITTRRRSGQLGVHPGHEWFTVLSGTARLQLGERSPARRGGPVGAVLDDGAARDHRRGGSPRDHRRARPRRLGAPTWTPRAAPDVGAGRPALSRRAGRVVG